MYGRWFNLAILFLWITMMSWLVKEKVLPPLLTGPPPDQGSLIEAVRADQEIGWLIRWNRRPLGWAQSKIDQDAGGLARITTEVHFDYLPLSDMLPDWLKKLPAWAGLKSNPETDSLLASDFSINTSLAADVTSEWLLSPEGKLRQIHSSITLLALDRKIDLNGKINDQNKVELDIETEGFSYHTKLALDPQLLMGNALTPQIHLPNLHAGQTWMVGTLSPFSYPVGSVDVMYAKVIGRETYQYGDKTIAAWLVEYRQQPNLEYTAKQNPRCRLWVHPDGMVLRQELRLFKATIIFERKPIAQGAFIDPAGLVE